MQVLEPMDPKVLRCLTRNNQAVRQLRDFRIACKICLDFSACPNILEHEFRRDPTYELIDARG